MAYYEVTAKFEVEADNAELAESYVASGVRSWAYDWDIKSVELSADQGDEEN